MRTMSHQKEEASVKREIVRENQIEILKLKKTITNEKFSRGAQQ